MTTTRVNETTSTSLDDFDLLKIVGRGSFGQVYLAKHRESTRVCAIKVIRKDRVCHQHEFANVFAERQVLRNVHHPFIISMMSTFCTSELMCFAMEFLNGGELYIHMCREKKFGEQKVRFYMAEIASAIGYLHDRSIIHRDIKLENILLDRYGHVRLSNFGLCKNNQYSIARTFCGTPQYMAPEIILGKPYTATIDWWSLGILAFEMTEGHLPFNAPNQAALFDQIVAKPLRVPITKNPIPGRSLWDFIGRLLIKLPEGRLGGQGKDWRELEAHPFFQQIPFEVYDRKQMEIPFVPEVTSETDTRYFESADVGQDVGASSASLKRTHSNDEFFDKDLLDNFDFDGCRAKLSRNDSTELQAEISNHCPFTNSEAESLTNVGNTANADAHDAGAASPAKK